MDTPGDLHGFQNRLKTAVSAVLESSIKEALVFHHDEADGLTSASLAKIAMEHLGLQNSASLSGQAIP